MHPLLRQLVHTLPGHILVLNTSLQYLAVNDSVCKNIMGLNLDDIIGQTDKTLAGLGKWTLPETAL
jgi:hypothetical protein